MKREARRQAASGRDFRELEINTETLIHDHRELRGLNAKFHKVFFFFRRFDILAALF